MRLGYWLASAAAIVALLSLPASANVSLRLSAASDGSSCEITDPGTNGIVTVYVLVRIFQGDVTGIRFAAPVPPTSGLTHIGDETPFVPIGDSQSDLSLGFGVCEHADVCVMQMQFIRTSPGDPCTLYMTQPAATYTDCTFMEHEMVRGDGVALNSNGQCNPVPIHDPSPADGAASVPLTTELNWEDGYYVCNAPLAPMGGDANLYFGTNSNPPFVGFIEGFPHPVGPLEPATKYYWRVDSQSWPYFGGPVWSFTTTESVATQQSTWGAIKALYR